MDPNETLRLMREADAEAREATDDINALNYALEALNYAGDLDAWLTAGGFLPDAWTRHPVITIPSVGLRVRVQTPVEARDHVDELLEDGYTPDEFEWEA